MKIAVKRIVITIAIAIFVFTLIALVLCKIWCGILYMFLGDMCGNEILKTELSPNGKHKAVAFIRDCGATTSFSPQVSIISKDDNLKNKAGNVFIGYHSQYVDVKWEDDSSLIVYYDCNETDVSKKETLKSGVRIKYIKK